MEALPMPRIPVSAAAALFMVSAAIAGPVERPTAYDEMIARQAKVHGVPEALVHRTVRRESRYNPRLVHNHCFGLMRSNMRQRVAWAIEAKPAASSTRKSI
jgi:soluble lytic murein transglycosylase-like protein